MKYEYTDKQIETAAKVAHECNRAYCVAIGDNSQPSWEWAEEWQRKASITSVLNTINGITPVDLFYSWRNEKIEAGWKYGVTKDPVKKEHPCIVESFDQLPIEQRLKDELYIQNVTTVLAALRAIEETLPGV